MPGNAIKRFYIIFEYCLYRLLSTPKNVTATGGLLH